MTSRSKQAQVDPTKCSPEEEPQLDVVVCEREVSDAASRTNRRPSDTPYRLRRTLADLIEICWAWTHLGSAVGSQLETVIGEEPIEKQDPDAMESVHHGLLRVVSDNASEADPVHEGDNDLAAHTEQCVG